MDLGAFLRPGSNLPVKVAAEDEGRDPPLSGRLLVHRDRPVWLCPVPQIPGRNLVLTVELPGFSLAADGGLKPAEPDSRVELCLLSRVRACRYFSPRAVYVLRLELLGRIWPQR